MKRYLIAALIFSSASCIQPVMPNHRTVPAEDFSKAYHEGKIDDFSFFRAADKREADQRAMEAQARARLDDPTPQTTPAAITHPIQKTAMGDAFLKQGYVYQGGIAPQGGPVVPTPQFVNTPAPMGDSPAQMAPLGYRPPPGSSAPYHNGQMTANPSLWPDEAQGAFLFRDFRAFEPMDVVTIVVRETQEGKKKAETDTETKFSISAAIGEFFGLETKNWASNNESLDPTNLLNAETNSKYEGTGETKRSGSLTGNISAVIMELLPNSLMRIEGSKIISVNNEEEVMVISGLVRQRDINASNEVDSSRIANMRIDFFGRGVVGDKQSPGWGARLFDWVWPF